MFDFEKRCSSSAKQTVLCVGDLMLDDFVYGEVARISPEAPTPVLAVKRNEIEIGGAGNVARNIAALGARCIFVGLVGDDEAGRTSRKALAGRAADRARTGDRHDAADDAQSAFRLGASSTHLLRADWEHGGAGRAPRAKRRSSRTRDAAMPQRRRGRALRLRQGRADAARDPRRHRRGAAGRQAGDRRSRRATTIASIAARP